MIDVRELRIGSHYYNNTYAAIGRVVSINGSMYNPEDVSVGLMYDMPLDKDSDPYDATTLPYIEPIPITEELLSELGFKYNPKWSSWRKEQTKINPFICINNMHDGLWRMEAMDDKYVYGNMICRYLHEAEVFLFLTTKFELVED